MPTHVAELAGSHRFVLADGRVPLCLAPGLDLPGDGEGLARCDIAVAEGHIVAISPPATAAGAEGPEVDLDGGLVLPRLVDIHTHLDKGHIWPRRPNPDGTFGGALENVALDREEYWTADDVRGRMDFALRCAFAHGTGAIRTHLDSVGPQTEITWPVFAEMRTEWQDRIALQGVAIYPVDMAVDDAAQFRALVATVARYGGVLGGVTFRGQPLGSRLALALDHIFDAAAANGLDLDFHVDESHSPDARTLVQIAEAALRHRFPGRIVAGHCCSLALAQDAEREDVIAKVVEAGIAIVSLPMVNMYLQDRIAGRTPRWRGVAPLHEIAAAGGRVMVASDNTRDPFHAYGDLDLIEVFREATRILHFDHSHEPWLRTVSETPADVMGLPAYGRILAGGPADLILTRARSLNELLSRPWTDRAVLVAGKPIDTRPPDYRELDALFDR
jgi:cytosine deaminase